MFARVRYIDWALRFYGKVPFDLASRGVPGAFRLSWASLPKDRFEQGLGELTTLLR